MSSPAKELPLSARLADPFHRSGVPFVFSPHLSLCIQTYLQELRICVIIVGFCRWEGCLRSSQTYPKLNNFQECIAVCRIERNKSKIVKWKITLTTTSSKNYRFWWTRRYFCRNSVCLRKLRFRPLCSISHLLQGSRTLCHLGWEKVVVGGGVTRSSFTDLQKWLVETVTSVAVDWSPQLRWRIWCFGKKDPNKNKI